MALSISTILFAVTILIITLGFLFILFYRFYFLRKPKRKVTKNNVIVSPASGKIVRIVKFGNKTERIDLEKGLLGKFKLLVKDTTKSGQVIVIMMTPFDVHYQRSPISGTIEKTMHKKGRFLNAVHNASSMITLQNEKNEILIRHNKLGLIKVVQIAGFLARRIHCFVKPKQKIHKGEELGLISLGSQVILVMPPLKLLVDEGQRVVDGETIIARF